jgi:hypothetical protein
MSNTLLPTTPLIAQQTPRFIDGEYGARFVWTFLLDDARTMELQLGNWGEIDAKVDGRMFYASEVEEAVGNFRFFVPFAEGLVAYRHLVAGMKEGVYAGCFSKAYAQQQG